MLNLPICDYRRRIEKILKYTNNGITTNNHLRYLNGHVVFFNRNLLDLLNNHEEIYYTEFEPILIRARQMIRSYKADVLNEMNQDLIGAMKNHSRWLINDLALHNRELSDKLEKILSSKRVTAACISTGSETIFKNMEEASRELKINSGIINKIVHNYNGSRTATSRHDNNLYSFEFTNPLAEN